MLDLRTTKEVVKILGEYVIDKMKALYNFTIGRFNWKLYLFWIFLAVLSYVYMYTVVPIFVLMIIPIVLIFSPYSEVGLFMLLYYIILIPLPIIMVEFKIVDSKIIKTNERIIPIAKYLENHDGYFMVTPEYEFISVDKKTFYVNKDKGCTKIKRYKEVQEPVNINKAFNIEKDIFLECLEHNKTKG
jgi:hypothetical protein